MRTLILCEGKTDAILISYLLSKVSGWQVGKGNIKIKVNDINNESSYWYVRGSDSLLICGVGGKNNFGNFFSSRICDIFKLYDDNDYVFDKLVVVCDRDNDSIVNIERKVIECLGDIVNNVKDNEWVVNQYVNKFNNLRKLDVLLLVIPNDREGALETVLLESLSERENGKYIVDGASCFVNEMKNYTDNIKKVRDELKAKLGVTFAILSPMKVFSYIDELIRDVNWENYEYIVKLFEKILKL